MSRAAMTQSRANITCRALRMCCNAACLAAEDSSVSTTRERDGVVGVPPPLLEEEGFVPQSPPSGSVTPAAQNIHVILEFIPQNEGDMSSGKDTGGKILNSK